MKTIKGLLNGTKILVRDKEILKYIKEDLEMKEKNKKIIEISLIEGLYLMEKNVLELYDNKKLDFFELLKKSTEITGDKNFYIKFLVYKDLKRRGYGVFTGYKFGADFRVYEPVQKNKTTQKEQREHSKFLVNVFPEEHVCSFANISGDVRLTRSVNKNLIYAIVNADNEIIYYSINLAKL